MLSVHEEDDWRSGHRELLDVHEQQWSQWHCSLDKHPSAAYTRRYLCSVSGCLEKLILVPWQTVSTLMKGLEKSWWRFWDPQHQPTYIHHLGCLLKFHHLNQSWSRNFTEKNMKRSKVGPIYEGWDKQQSNIQVLLPILYTLVLRHDDTLASQAGVIVSCFEQCV